MKTKHKVLAGAGAVWAHVFTALKRMWTKTFRTLVTSKILARNGTMGFYVAFTFIIS